MKLQKLSVLLFSVIWIAGCNGNAGNETTEQAAPAEPRRVTTEEVKDKSFDELFTKIAETEIPDNVFQLVGKDYTVITSGNPERYNSMVASWGGWGIMFEKPVTWCMLRANRYTLELMREYKTYTMAYFDDNFKDQIMLFGTQSGRNTEKMKESTLTAVQTPSGSMSFKEAKLIIECELSEVTTVSPDDFSEPSSRQFIEEGYGDAKEYHKLVFGNITGIWVRK
ncbi:MAG: flavin reductase [Candidatus Azobacteroides sp.]|nr:flavin reductase [Candidatus Azobacteroides sp.]